MVLRDARRIQALGMDIKALDRGIKATAANSALARTLQSIPGFGDMPMPNSSSGCGAPSNGNARSWESSCARSAAKRATAATESPSALARLTTLLERAERIRFRGVRTGVIPPVDDSRHSRRAVGFFSGRAAGSPSEPW
jgi:hypothetical protein